MYLYLRVDVTNMLEVGKNLAFDRFDISRISKTDIQK